MIRTMLLSIACAFLFGSALADRVAAAESLSSSVIGIDHMPFVVADVDEAAADYRKLGFAIKPGRFHTDGIRNSHVKFPDGSGIELITASARTDELTGRYLELLHQEEGPVYLGFHAWNRSRLVAAAARAGLELYEDNGMTVPKDPQLRFLFIGGDNRSPTDRPENFAHANSAMAMCGVWVALADPSSLIHLLVSLGGVETHRVVFAPGPVSATVITVQNGDVIVLPISHQLFEHRPIVGAEFRVSSLAVARRTLSSVRGLQSVVDSNGVDELLVPPSAAHGIWLDFRER